MTRFKLYSIDADEHISILALARLKADPWAFDPGLYQYGGGWLYPLGAWYFALQTMGFIQVGSLDAMLASPDRIDSVFVWGRVLVLLSVSLAGLIVFTTLRRLGGQAVALAGLTVFLFAPATIVYSQLMKPHWFALVWVALTVDRMVRLALDNPTGWRNDAILGIAVGMTYASANTYAPFTVFVWLGLAILWRSGHAPFRYLVSVPAIALATWLAMSPHLILHFDAFRFAAEWVGGWFEPSLSIGTLAGFIWNSGFRGFGFAFLGTLLAAAVFFAIRPQTPGQRPLALAVLATIAFYAWLTSSMVIWGNNSRYAPYLLIGGLILLAGIRVPAKATVAWVLAGMTVVQSVPLMLAYADENDPAHSTRLRMAEIINTQVPDGARVCSGSATAAPFETPPFDFTRYRVNMEPCDFTVLVQRHHVEQPAPEGLEIIAQVSPRLFTPSYRLVLGHINPRFTLYQPQ